MVEVCDGPRHLLLRSEPGTDDESQIEAWHARWTELTPAYQGTAVG